jgi:hypothetical protein
LKDSKKLIATRLPLDTPKPGTFQTLQLVGELKIVGICGIINKTFNLWICTHASHLSCASSFACQREVLFHFSYYISGENTNKSVKEAWMGAKNRRTNKKQFKAPEIRVWHDEGFLVSKWEAINQPYDWRFLEEFGSRNNLIFSAVSSHTFKSRQNVRKTKM